MALDVVGRSGVSGRVVIEDTRDDGTVVLLYCEETGGGAGVVLKRDVEKPSSPGGFPWPSGARSVAASRGLTEADLEPFELVIDVTSFPAGGQAFRMGQFVSRAIHLARDGVRTVELTVDNAAEWGWVHPAGADVTEELL